MSNLRVKRYQEKIINKTCIECNQGFTQMRRLLAVCDRCKPERAKRLRPQTFKICQACNNSFGPVNRLSQKTCSVECGNKIKVKAIKKIRKPKPMARRAQGLLKYHVDKGNLTRPKICEECGCDNKKIEGAHKDYSRPLDVRWLCRSCHVKWDKREPKNATYVLQNYTGKDAVLESSGQTYNSLCGEK